MITFVGASCVVFGGMLISMQLNLSKKISEKVEEKVDTPVENTTENAPVPEKIPEKAQEIIPTNDKFAMYDNVNKIQQVLDNSREIPQVQDVVNKIPTQNEDEERSKLQSKIKEIIKKMQNKSENNVVEEKKPSKNLLEKIEFSTPKNKTIDMNFKNISEEDNLKVEQALISSGFKLLSEVRIGSTGIDYIGVAKDKIVVVQLDTSEGNWFASEDKVEGNETPIWFSEKGNKISPIFRVLEAKNNIQNLLGDVVDLPIESVACLTNSNVVNYSEVENSWKNLGVNVVKLNENNDEDEFVEMSSLAEIYPVQSQQEIDEESMNKIISVLEKAEIPE